VASSIVGIVIVVVIVINVVVVVVVSVVVASSAAGVCSAPSRDLPSIMNTRHFQRN